MLRRVAAIPLLSAVLPGPMTATRAADPPRSVRRVRPSDPSWPSEASWERLNREVGGHLIKVQSPLAACADAADSAACQEVLRNLKNPYFIGDQPGLTQTSGWVDAWMSAPSAYAVVARGTADVVAAVNFAREHNLRLVIKGGGHSYQGTSNAADSLLIWGDIVHMPGVQFARPGAGMGFDIDGAQAIATRQRIMDMAATDRLLVAGMHLDFPAFGHLARAGDGYAFIPAVWTP